MNIAEIAKKAYGDCMEPITIHEIAVAVGNNDPKIVENNNKILMIITDTRIQAGEIAPENCLFAALRGENFDGHRYVGQALRTKAAYALVDKKGMEDNPVTPEEEERLIYCEDTEQGFLDISGYYRNQFNPKVVAITGSVGKTTTKEMIAQVISSHYNTLKTQGNFNNRVGMPKTLLELDDSIEVAVIEMGMSSFGEISDLTHRARPDMAVITNIGVSHIEYLGCREGILKAKLEVLEGMKPGAILILCKDDDMLSKVRDDRFSIITYGIGSEDCTIRGVEIEESGNKTNFKIIFAGKDYPVCLPTFGTHNVENALAAFAAGKYCGMEPEEIIEALAKYKPSGMRQKLVELDTIRVVEDCYNAGPDSMVAAIHTFSAMARDKRYPGRKILVIGDMLELGDLAKQAHYDIGNLVAKSDIDILYCYGELSKESSLGAREALGGDHSRQVLYFLEKQALTTDLLEQLKRGDTVWFKASRGMKLEEVISRIYEQF